MRRVSALRTRSPCDARYHPPYALHPIVRLYDLCYNGRWVEDPRFARLHLFYRGPVVIAPLLGALIAPAKPLVVYHYEDGRYRPAYTLDRRFLIGKD